jgi:hypothetical protein
MPSIFIRRVTSQPRSPEHAWVSFCRAFRFTLTQHGPLQSDPVGLPFEGMVQMWVTLFSMDT